MFKFTLLLVAIAGIFAMSVEAGFQEKREDGEYAYDHFQQEKREDGEYAHDHFRQEKREEMESSYLDDLEHFYG